MIRRRLAALVLALAPVSPASAGMILDIVNGTVFDTEVIVVNLTVMQGPPRREALTGNATIRKTLPASDSSYQFSALLNGGYVCNGIIDVTSSAEGARCAATIVDNLAHTGLAAAIRCPTQVQQGGENCTVTVRVETASQ